MSIPFYGRPFTFTQPDGSQLHVRGWGDQHYASFETDDGFAVVQDPVTGFFHYAEITPDGDDIRPTGVRPGAANPATLGLKRGARLNAGAFKTRVHESPGLIPGRSRWEVRRERAKAAARVAAAAPGIAPAPPHRQTVGDYVGLCLLVEFPDVPRTITPAQVNAFCNDAGYAEFGNKGSVRDYFLDESRGKLRYTSIVAPYHKAKHPRSYYTNETVPQPARARELVREVLDHLKATGFDFSGLTADDEGYVYAVNLFYTGPVVNNWSKGLWPHSYHLAAPYQLRPGKLANDYQITNIGSELTLGTFCHENGHMICDFPDLYDYGNESRGIGVYCLMCAGGLPDPRNPAQISAYLKYKAGWAESVTRLTGHLNATATVDKNQFFFLPKNQSEYFILENREKIGRDASLTSAGLAIWHVDELGDNSNEQMTPSSHYECALVQADGKFQMEHGENEGDPGDLFSASGKDSFSGSTKPNSKWWDGTPSGLEISHVGPPGVSIKFSANV